MMKVVVYYFKLMVMMICAIVGVGFVSGAEIYSFFVKFGNFSYISVILFFILMFFLILKILNDKTNEKNIVKLNKFHKNKVKNTNKEKDKIKSILIFLNILMVAAAMFSGFFEIVKQLFINNYYLIYIIVVCVVYFLLCIGVSGLEKFDIFVIILLMFISAVFCLNLIKDGSIFVFYKNGEISAESGGVKILMSSIFFVLTYVFMNIASVRPIVDEFDFNLAKKGKVKFSAMFSFFLSAILFLFILFLSCHGELFQSKMPFLEYFKQKGNLFYCFFVIGLVCALLSSLLSALFGVKRVANKLFKLNIVSSGVSMIIAIVLSFIGFSNFVNIVYPIIGIINFVIYVFL